jgi:predicted 2-oxoglutarate/Fe(II)-dependent dioxygenase YbiX
MLQYQDFAAGSHAMASGQPKLIVSGGIAPVAIVKHVFDADLCRRLIDYYTENESRESGVMRAENGITVEVHDHAAKRRRDCEIGDAALSAEINECLFGTLRPAISKAFNFDFTRIERHIIGCYDAVDGGHFAAHRDNNNKGTAHRRFACTINLNAEKYEGGNLTFPEFGDVAYRAQTGTAIVLSCSLLHQALPVTRGRRFAFLPFFYDEAAAEIRKHNLQFLDPAIVQGIKDAEARAAM